MDVLDLTKQLVSLPSDVGEGRSEKPVADFLFDYLEKYFPWLKLEKQFIARDRYNIIALPKNDPRLVFISHMDTVLPAGDVQERLNSQVKGNRLTGLGALDMKGGLAASIVALFESGKRDDIALIFDCDEEYYFKGIIKLVDKYRFRPDLVIFPEPTNLKIVNGCRGIVEISFDVLGKTAHAGSPQLGVNAIEKAVELIQLLKLNLNINKFSSKGKTTVNLSALKGGRLNGKDIIIQANAIPDIARALLDVRIADKMLNASNIIKFVKQTAKKLKVKVVNRKVNLDYLPFYCEKTELGKLEKAVKKVIDDVKYADISRTGFFEAGFVADRWACPVVALGPGPKEKSHQVDEYVNIGDLVKAKNIFLELIGN